MTPRSWIRKLFARTPRTLRKAPARRPALEALEDRLTPAYPAITLLTGAANPWGGIDVGVEAKPALGDVDGDGDRDLIVGESDGTLRYFKNTGTAASPVYTQQLGAANPFNGVDVGFYSAPALGDVDGDGDRDALVGAADGTLRYYRNTGTATSPVYVQQLGAANPWGSVDVGDYAGPSLGDVDGDGDPDALVGAGDGTLRYYRNTGTATGPVYVEQTGAANPWGGIDVGVEAKPALGDVDGDGDRDAVVGESTGTLVYFKNTGTATGPVYAQQTGAASPFNGFDVGTYSTPALGGVDGDGDLDLIVGAQDGTLNYFRNDAVPPAVNAYQLTDAANPFNGVDVGLDAAPALGDVDGDGDLDALVGTFSGTLLYFRNTGTAVNPVYVQQTGAANPFNGVDVGDYAAPALGDVDGDGDLDAVVGMGGSFNPGNGQFRYYKNTGTSVSPVYVQQTGAANPWGGFNTGDWSTPALGDVDGDGDLDAVAGEYFGVVNYYKNTGTATNPVYAEQFGAASPFDGIAIGLYSKPALGDVDGDGDRDLIVGEQRNGLFYYKNTGTAVNPVYVQQTGAANPWGVVFAWRAAPVLADVDGDGDGDALVGEDAGRLFSFRTNRTPFVVNTIPDQTFSGPGVHSYAVPPDTLLDLDNNTLTYSATLAGGGALPAWLSFNPATRTFSGNPAPGDATPLQLVVNAADGQGASADDDFRLTLVNVFDNLVTQTVLVSSLSPSTYGQAVTFTATVTSGGVPRTQGTVTFREGATVLAGPLAVNAGGQAGFTIATLGAGLRTLTAQYSGHGDFGSSSGNVGQTVNRAPLVIQADDKTKVAGQAVPPLTATYSGFVLGQGPANLTTLPTLSTSNSNTAGTYPITVSGAASPNYLIAYLNGTLTVTPAATSALALTGLLASLIAGTPATLTVSARDPYGNVTPGYRGTVRFSSSDPVAGLPANYTFTAADNGVHTFANGVTLYVAGTQTVTATDTLTAAITGTASAAVRPGPVALYYVYPGSELATTVTQNVPTAIYIFPFDQYYNWITTYAGTIAFYTPDPLGVVPANYTFTGTEGGIGVPGTVTFGTLGMQELYVWDHPGVTVFGYAQYDVQAGAAPGGSPAGVVAALSAAEAAGTAAPRFADRAAPRPGSGPRNDGHSFPDLAGPDVTAFDDGAVAGRSGASGQDWFFAHLSGSVLDVIDALGGAELVAELSVPARSAA